MTAHPAPTGQRIALLSFAHYHANYWAEVFAARGVLGGIWDDDEARGREAAQRFAAPYFGDLGALLAASTAVAICCETSRHPELVERSAARGLAVLVEKPLAVSVAEGERIGAAVRRHGITFMQSFPKRLDPVSLWIKQTVETEALGRLTLVRIRHGHHYGLTDEFRHRWYVRPELSGGGALIDEGIHGIDLLNWLFGLPVSVSATVSHAALRLPVEDLGVATFTYASGLVAELTASFCFTAADASIELYGTTGTALISAVDLASRDVTHEGFVRVCRYRPDDPPGTPRRWETISLTPRFKQGRFHQQSAEAFLECLSRHTAPPASVDDGMRALRVVEAAYEAARSGRRQDLTL